MEFKRLGEYCTITSSKRIFADQYVENGIPFYRSREIIEKNNHSDLSEPLFISHEVFENIKEKFGVPQKDDLLLTSVGTLGIPYLVKDECFYFKDGNLTWMKEFSDELSSHYLYYWLSSSFGKESLINRCIGSSQSALTIDILKKYKLIIPARDIQDRIVSILGKYNALIELNTKRIKTLEQMAENLYKEWFVRFRFPGHENAEFENGIPKGWAKVRAEKAITFNPTIKTNNQTSFTIIPMEALSTTSMVLDRNSFTVEDSITGKRSQNGDTLMAKITPCLENGKTGFVMGLPEGEVFGGSTEFVVMRSKTLSPYYVYFLARSHYFRQTAILSMNGADGRQRVSEDKLKSTRIIQPPKDILKKFDANVSSIFEAIKTTVVQNENLIKQRNLLLPRLMSGKLEV